MTRTVRRGRVASAGEMSGRHPDATGLLVGQPDSRHRDQEAQMRKSTMEATAVLVGTWQLVSFTATMPDGTVIYPLGPDAEGVITYTGEGHMSVAVWEAGRQPFAVADPTMGTAAEYAAAARGYIQYVGTYTCDDVAGTVSHHIEQSVFPNFNGTTLVRSYTFVDGADRLKLSTPPTAFGGATMVATVVFERV